MVLKWSNCIISSWWLLHSCCGQIRVWSKYHRRLWSSAQLYRCWALRRTLTHLLASAAPWRPSAHIQHSPRLRCCAYWAFVVKSTMNNWYLGCDHDRERRGSGESNSTQESEPLTGNEMEVEKLCPDRLWCWGMTSNKDPMRMFQRTNNHIKSWFPFSVGKQDKLPPEAH